MSNKLKRRSPNYSSNRLQSAGNAAGAIRYANVGADPKYFLLENNNSRRGGGGSTPRSSARGLDPARPDASERMSSPGSAGRSAGGLNRTRPTSLWQKKQRYTSFCDAQGTKPVLFSMQVVNKVSSSRRVFFFYYSFLSFFYAASTAARFPQKAN